MAVSSPPISAGQVRRGLVARTTAKYCWTMFVESTLPLLRLRTPPLIPFRLSSLSLSLRPRSRLPQRLRLPSKTSASRSSATSDAPCPRPPVTRRPRTRRRLSAPLPSPRRRPLLPSLRRRRRRPLPRLLVMFPLRPAWPTLRKAPTRLSLQLRKVWWEDVSLCNDSHDGMTEKQRQRKSLL